jgi:hypothetical protein
MRAALGDALDLLEAHQETLLRMWDELVWIRGTLEREGE